MRHLLEYRRYRLPFRAPLRTAQGGFSEREGLILRLQDEAGRVGFGEAATLPWFGTESAEVAEERVRMLGRSPDSHDLERIPVSAGCVRNAYASALMMIAGEALPEAKPLPVAALLPAGRAALGRVASLAATGFRTFKWKVGVGDLADELALLDDVCAQLPDGARLRLDANGAWDRRQAERWLERTAERPVEFVEQPAFAKAAEGAARVRRMEDLLLGLAGDFPTPLALDESLVGDGDVERWVGAGWPGIYVIKPSLCADPGAVLARLAAAKANVVFSSALETALGARTALGWAFRWAGPARALGFGVWPLFADARFDGPSLAPFIRIEDVQRIDPEAVWNALS